MGGIKRRMRVLVSGLALLVCLTSQVPVVQAASSITGISYTAAKDLSYAPDGKALGPVESMLYEQLSAGIRDVAEGRRTSTQFSFQTPYSAAELGSADLNLLVTYLLADLPLDLFWHDKTRTVENGEGTDGVYCYYQQGGTVEFNLKVSTDYRKSPSELFEVNPEAIARSGAARQTAKNIVAANAGLSDYEKLKAYRDVICNMAAYDFAAASGNAYGDAHQAVYALDNDPNTNIVCEGYAKAFKYLCDLSTFTHDVKCYLVNGVSDAGNGAGDHMWNLVRIGGSESYLVDVTNCDSGSIGADYELFLTDKATGSVTGGYTFLCNGRDAITYYYDGASLDAYGPTILSLSNVSHEGLNSLYPATKPGDMPVADTVPEPVPTEDPDEGNLSDGNLHVELPVTGRLSFAEEEVYKTYGDEPFALATSEVPDGAEIRWQSSDDSIATVIDGMVHILRPGTVTIKADAGVNLATCTLVIGKRPLSWDTSGLYAADPGDGWDAILTGELGITGMLPEDVDAGAKFRFDSSSLSGIFSGQKISLNWKEGQKWVLTGAKADYYELPEVLPDLEGRITATYVLDTPPESEDAQPLKLEMEPELATVPEALLENQDLNTPDKIVSKIEAALDGQDGSVVSQVFLAYQDGDGNWVRASEGDFPEEGITVTIPYPIGTSKDTQDFVICHMFGEDGDGHTAGDLEYPEVTETETGLQFKVYSLSPIAVGWRDQVGQTISPANGVMSDTSIFLYFGLGAALISFAIGMGIKTRR